MDPRHTDSVADLQLTRRASLLDHAAHHFVTRNERPLHDAGQLFPIAAAHVQIGMAHAAGLDLNQDFFAGGLRPGDLLNDEGPFELVQDGRPHPDKLPRP
ncbi:MAG TPA: hypothetical protein VE734_05540 [Terriglobales bacterium]|nr:hypothetical protein [Terriglobales bacterium]